MTDQNTCAKWRELYDRWRAADQAACKAQAEVRAAYEIHASGGTVVSKAQIRRLDDLRSHAKLVRLEVDAMTLGIVRDFRKMLNDTCAMDHSGCSGYSGQAPAM